MRNILKQNGFTGARRGDDQGTLALPDRANQINDPGRTVTDRRILDFHLQALIRVKRRQVVEVNLVPRLLGIVEVDLRRLDQAEIPFILARSLNNSLDRVTGAQAELSDHLRPDINIIGAGQIVG